MPERLPISIAIPTYNREQVLLDTIDDLLGMQHVAAEILVLDQTEIHQSNTVMRLKKLDETNQIRWLRLDTPSIPKAMNRGLQEAKHEIVLFLDDDICPEPELLNAHLNAHQEYKNILVAGRVIQPWQEIQNFSNDKTFHFASQKSAWISEFMAGNFSVRRGSALALGGFDENFVRVAYRFEAEFAHRWLKAGWQIRYEPAAVIHHLKARHGGTRAFGEHLTTCKPDHAVGAYYYCLSIGAVGEFLRRPFQAVTTRYHLRYPWQIPLSFLAELWGMIWAVCLFLNGPRYIK